MFTIEAWLNEGAVLTRQELSALTGMDDRTVRDKIRRLRRSGVPIMAMKNGGYKIAKTDAEMHELLMQYRKRAMDELVTYSKLRKLTQAAGQITCEDIAREAERA